MLIELTNENCKKVCIDGSVIRTLFHYARKLSPGPIESMNLIGGGGELIPEDAIAQLQTTLENAARIWHGDTGIQAPERLILEWRPKLDAFLGESETIRIDTWSNFNRHSHRPPAGITGSVTLEKNGDKLPLSLTDWWKVLEAAAARNWTPRSGWGLEDDPPPKSWGYFFDVPPGCVMECRDAESFVYGLSRWVKEAVFPDPDFVATLRKVAVIAGHGCTIRVGWEKTK